MGRQPEIILVVVVRVEKYAVPNIRLLGAVLRTLSFREPALCRGET